MAGDVLRSRIQNLKARVQNGVVPAMATPVQADGYHLNRVGLRHLIDFLIEAGVKGLFVGGTTGEGILLDVGERKLLHEQALELINGRALALLHVGANTTATTLELTRHAVTAGAEAIVAVTPHFYPVSDDGLLAFYRAIAEEAPDTPLLAYDIPHQATNGISPALLPRLAEIVPSFAGVKSSRMDAQVVRQLIDAAPEHTAVFAGNERIALGLLALGADALISGLSTAVPEPLVALTRAFAAGDLAEAQRQQRLINRIIDLIPAGARIGALKAILAERGIEAGPAVPPRPMPPSDWRGWLEIETILAER